MVDFGPLLNPRTEPTPRLMSAIDFSSWALPVISAFLAVAGGCASYNKADPWPALLSIFGGIIGAVAVLMTNWSSRIRDNRIEQAKSLAALSVDTAESIQRHLPLD